jgi:hypothetical protein
MYRKHKNELAELQSQLANDGLRIKFLASMDANIMLKEQVAQSMQLLDATLGTPPAHELV